MPCLDCFQARIHVDGKPLQEYPISQTEPDSEHRITRYVEVSTGQKFSIELTWLEQFELHSAPALRAEVQIDNQSSSCCFNIDCSDVYQANGKTTAALRRCMSSVIRKDQPTETWMRYTLEFDDLRLSESSGDTLSNYTVSKLGSIRVRVYRARKIELDTPRRYAQATTPPIDEVPEEKLKGNPIKNKVKYGNGTLVQHVPEAITYDYLPIKGRHGKVQEIAFLYRTRNTLQQLGVIPRSLTPEPDVRLRLDRAEETLRLSKQKEAETARREHEARREVFELRKRLNKFESGDPGIAAASSDDSTMYRGAKRAHEEGEDDELTEMAPPPRKSKVVIDLTEDADD